MYPGVSEKRVGSGGAEEEERTDNVWIQSSRNPTQNFVHPLGGVRGGFGLIAIEV